jgi:hypothetical protein
MDDEGVNRLWKLRQSNDAKAFRKWFHDNVRDRPEEAEALFIDTMVKPTLGDNVVVRGLRFFAFAAVPEAVAAISGAPPGLGLLAAVADSFLVDRFLRPRGPKIMIDRLRGILPEPSRE